MCKDVKRVVFLVNSREHLHGILKRVGNGGKSLPSVFCGDVAIAHITEDRLPDLQRETTVLSEAQIPVYKDGDEVQVTTQVCFKKTKTVDGKRVYINVDLREAKEKVERLLGLKLNTKSGHRSEAGPLGSVVCGGYKECNVFEVKVQGFIPEGGSDLFNAAVVNGVGMRGSYGFGMVFANVSTNKTKYEKDDQKIQELA